MIVNFLNVNTNQREQNDNDEKQIDKKKQQLIKKIEFCMKKPHNDTSPNLSYSSFKLRFLPLFVSVQTSPI